MKYETIGGDTLDTADAQTSLRYLKAGDRFKIKSTKDIFEVIDERCNWNGQAGSPTRRCKNLTTNTFEHKLCRNSVIKL